MAKPTAIVKGAGPSGLSAAITLAQEGFEVTVFEKRPQKPKGHGRQNMVAIRPEALHQLDLLGVLSDLDGAGVMTPIHKADTTNEADGNVFVWPLDSQARYPLPSQAALLLPGYRPPVQLDDQVPSTYVTLGDLEDCLTAQARQRGVSIRYCSTVRLLPAADSDRHRLVIINPDGSHVDAIGRADLIICASGKGDSTIASELGFKKSIGNKLSDDILPHPGSRELRLGPENEMETQKYSVFGVRTPAAKMGVLRHVVRKHEGDIPQQVVEIEMSHASATHCILQIPRGFPIESSIKLKFYVLGRINKLLGTSFDSINDLMTGGTLLWGNPFSLVTVETAIAPKFAFGSDVILVGDAGMSCSPSSGLGADIGLTHDVQGVRELARQIARSTQVDDVEAALRLKTSALDAFNIHKAKGSIQWSKGSGFFYVSTAEAKRIVDYGQINSGDESLK